MRLLRDFKCRVYPVIRDLSPVHMPIVKELLKLDVQIKELEARAKRPTRLPVVLTRSEARQVLELLTGTERLVAGLLYRFGVTDF